MKVLEQVPEICAFVMKVRELILFDIGKMRVRQCSGNRSAEGSTHDSQHQQKSNILSNTLYRLVTKRWKSYLKLPRNSLTMIVANTY